MERKHMNTIPTNDEQLRAEVRARYAKTALQVLATEPTTQADACCGPACCSPSTTNQVLATEPTAQADACCGPACCSPSTTNGDAITSDLYNEAELGTIPL